MQASISLQNSKLEANRPENFEFLDLMFPRRRLPFWL
jgi:hypothetical protein